MPFWLHFSMDRQHFHIRKKPEISLSECFSDNGLTKNNKNTRFGMLRKHLLSHWRSLGKKEREWDKETKTKVSATANQRKQKYPNEPMRIYSKSNQTAKSEGKQEWPQVAQARKMSFSKCANMFSLLYSLLKICCRLSSTLMISCSWYISSFPWPICWVRCLYQKEKLLQDHSKK